MATTHIPSLVIGVALLPVAACGGAIQRSTDDGGSAAVGADAGASTGPQADASVDATSDVMTAPRHQAGNCPIIPPGDAGAPTTGCSIVGRFSLSNSHGSVQSTGVIEFDPDGAYYGGPPGTDLSQTYVYDGMYSVSGSTFYLIYSCGDGSCVGSGTFAMQFQAGCSVVMLHEQQTQCTGNRTSVAGDVILTRQ